MFEKEAEEWTIDYVCKDCSRYEKCKSKEHCTCKECSKDKWQNGAEFGYNKANEWHYVKDELPDEGTYLVIWQNDKGYKEIFIMHYEEDDEGELHWIDGDCEVQDEYIIAWKEITLPKADLR